MKNKPRPDLAKEEMLQRFTSLVFGEAADQKIPVKKTVASTVINRLDSKRDKEFGKNIDKVIMNDRSPYYASHTKETGKPSERFMQAYRYKFDNDPKGAAAYEDSAEIAKNMFDRTEKPTTKAEFFFKPNEAKKLKKDLRRVGSSGPYGLYSY
jgi:hypothetical protein